MDSNNHNNIIAAVAAVGQSNHIHTSRPRKTMYNAILFCTFCSRSRFKKQKKTKQKEKRKKCVHVTGVLSTKDESRPSATAMFIYLYNIYIIQAGRVSILLLTYRVFTYI